MNSNGKAKMAWNQFLPFQTLFLYLTNFVKESCQDELGNYFKALFRLWTILFSMFLMPLVAWGQITVTGATSVDQCDRDNSDSNSYTISIKNDSGSDMTSLAVLAKLENLIGFSHLTGSTSIDVDGEIAFCTADPVISGGYSGACSPDPGEPYLSWDIDTLCSSSPFTLGDGETLNITFKLQTSSSAVSGSLQTYVDYDSSGSSMCDDTGVLGIDVNPGAVTITKTPTYFEAEPDDPVSWTITVENTGTGDIKNVEVTDVLEEGLTFDTATQGGDNSGQTTNWTANEYPALARMGSGEVLTMDIDATVGRCGGDLCAGRLENTADVRFGCYASPSPASYDTSVDGGTARAFIQHPSVPYLEFTPPDITFTSCSETQNVMFAIANIGKGIAYDVSIGVDFEGLVVSDVSTGASYNVGGKRFELVDSLAKSGDSGDSYTLSFDLTSSECNSFPAENLLWQNLYTDEDVSGQTFSHDEFRNIPSPGPTVTTATVGNIAATTATGNGNITDLGVSAPTAHGVCYATSANPTAPCTDEGAASATGAFTSSMTGLTSGTLYYVRAYAVNTAGTRYGLDVVFSTNTVPTVTTSEVTAVQSSSVVCGGDVSGNGGAAITERGVCWSLSQNPTTDDDCMVETVTGSGLGSFSTTIQPLRSSTAYYTRAFATNSAGTAYGTTKAFKTKMYFYLNAIPAISQSLMNEKSSGDDNIGSDDAN